MLSVLLRLRYGYDNCYQRWAKRNKSYVRGRISMRWYVLLPLFCLIVVSPGCRKRETPPPVPRSSQESNQARVDVCGLLTREEIETVQRSPVKETKVARARMRPFLYRNAFIPR